MENSIIELLTSISVVCGIGVVLAFLLELTNKYFADYGEKRILINDEKELVITGGSPLLSTLKKENIFIPSACGGKGTCAYCKIRVLDGGGPVLPTETPYLSTEELEDYVRLSCQVKVKEDLKIRIPEELFLVKQFRAKVIELANLTPEIKELRLASNPPKGLLLDSKFRAGFSLLQAVRGFRCIPAIAASATGVPRPGSWRWRGPRSRR